MATATKFDWMTCDDPAAMLKALSPQNSPRKTRLSMCGLLRSIAELNEKSIRAINLAERISDGKDMRNDREWAEITHHFERSELCEWGYLPTVRNYNHRISAWILYQNSVIENHFRRAFENYAYICEPQKACDILREIFPDPTFQWVITKHAEGRPSYREIDNSDGRELRLFRECWRTSNVTDLARSMYNSNDFSGTPVLADALEEAGCQDERILRHCRSTCSRCKGTGRLDSSYQVCPHCDSTVHKDGWEFGCGIKKNVHVKGCWVVDLCLGLE